MTLKASNEDRDDPLALREVISSTIVKCFSNDMTTRRVFTVKVGEKTKVDDHVALVLAKVNSENTLTDNHDKNTPI